MKATLIQIVLKDEKGFIRNYTEFDPKFSPSIEFEIDHFIGEAIESPEVNIIEIHKRYD